MKMSLRVSRLHFLQIPSSATGDPPGRPTMKTDNYNGRNSLAVFENYKSTVEMRTALAASGVKVY